MPDNMPNNMPANTSTEFDLTIPPTQIEIARVIDALSFFKELQNIARRMAFQLHILTEPKVKPHEES